MRPILRRTVRAGMVLFAAVILCVSGVRLFRQPRLEREWIAPQAVAPRVVVRGEEVGIRGVRDFAWRSESDFEVRHIEKRYDLRELDSVWYVISRFGGVPGLAHSFVTFGFGDDYVAISVEARREIGEAYSPWLGMIDAYELMYVIGTERDLIGMRTHVWKEDVSLYPVRATPEAMRALFLEMTARADKLATEPESYHTLFNSCASNVVSHVNRIAPGRVPLRAGLFLPGWSDRVAWEAELIDSPLTFEEAREAHRIGAAARRLPLDEGFSRAIRTR